MSIEEIQQQIEFGLSVEEKKTLLKNIFFGDLTSDESDQLLIDILDDMKQSEIEFENRKNFINAYTNLITNLKSEL